MEEQKCPECGAVLAEGASVCPQCSCPVPKERPAGTADAVKPPVSSTGMAAAPAASGGKKTNLMPLISLAIGVIILLLGIFTATRKADGDLYPARQFDVSRVTFGADFYTEIYGASDTIVDELNEINSGLSVSMCAGINAVYFSAGMVVIAVGLGTIAASCIYLKKET